MLKTHAKSRRDSAALKNDDRAVAAQSSSDTAFVIETAEIAAGIVIRQAGGFRFFAADAQFSLLDGSIFKTPKAAEKAAELMYRAAARDHAAARRFGDWGQRDERRSFAG